MRKRLAIYIASVALLLSVFIYFNAAYKALTNDSEFTNRLNKVLSNFQSLSQKINNAAVFHPDLIKAHSESRLFYADSTAIYTQVAALKATVKDSFNIRIAAKLDTLIKAEISWLVNSNVPDSIINNRAAMHVAAFEEINSLLGAGIERTNYLVEYRNQRLNDQIEKVKFIIILFVVLSGLMLLYTSYHLLKQQSKNVRESKKAEEQITKTLKEISDYKFALDEASIVAITDQKGIIRHANDNFCKISKYSRTELIGQDHRIINSGHHPKEFIRNLWVTIANGKIWKGELKNRAKDGSIYWVDTTIIPFLDNEKKPYQYVAIRADITERKLAEENLQKSLREIADYKYALDESSILAITDQKGIIKYANQNFCNISKYSLGELIGQDHRIINSGYHPKEFIRDLWVTIANGKIWKGELKNKAKDGTVYWVDTTIVPLLDEKRKPYQYLAIRADITERKKAEEKIIQLNAALEEKVIQRTEELQKANMEMETFTYSVSHDLRAPLRGMIGFTSILEEDYSNKMDEEARRITSVIKSNATKMGRLIDDLLAFSRMGKKELLKTRIDTNAMVHEVVNELLQQNKGNERIKWEIDKLPAVSADANTLRQVWINFLSNAIKYSGNVDQPVITIQAVEKEDGSIVFSIKDNGVGFDELYSSKLFKVFQRLHDPEEFEGTGVGLALIEKIISKHGGKVWAEGKPDEGACFYFSLPLN